jgi:hypothetical protein
LLGEPDFFLADKVDGRLDTGINANHSPAE